VRGWWLIVAVAGCFDPRVSPGGACGPGDRCPAGLECVAGTCELSGTLAGADASVDAPAQDDPPDARPDARPDASAPDAFVDPSLIAHWAFDDEPGDGALDSSGHGHTATCTNCPLVVPGLLGMGYRFDAVNDALVVEDSMEFRGDVTIALWARPDATTNQIAALSKVYSGGNTWQLELMPSDRWSFSGGSVHYLEGGPVTTPQTWHHVAGTWDGTTKRLYVDGVMVTSVAATLTYDTGDIVLGADINGGAFALFWDGVLDDVRVYDRALDAAEIAALAGPPPPP
jgi:hypothetical protein